jgi:hypothetical protein
MHVPSYVWAAGAERVVCPDGFQIPKYWDPVYQAKYGAFVRALAARYDGDPRLEFIQIGVGTFGETQPCDYQDDAYVQAAMEADGLYAWDWPDVCERHHGALRRRLCQHPADAAQRAALYVRMRPPRL